MSLHKFRCIGIWQYRVEGRLRLTFILMNIHKHGVPDSANEIIHNICQYGVPLEITFGLRRKFGCHFLANSEWNIAQLKILTDSIPHEMHDNCQILLNSDNSDHFKIIRQENGANVTECFHNVTSVTSTVINVSCHELPVTILEAAISLAHWKVNRRWTAKGCHQVHSTQCNILLKII